MKKLIFPIMTALVFALTTACSGGGAAATPSEAPAPTSEVAPPVSETAPEESEALSPDVQAIVDRGVLRVGVKVDVPHFGYQNPDTNELEGLEVDIAKALAARLLGGEDKISFTAVTAKTRGPLLDNNELDVIIATFTITEERKLSYNFTEPYFVDGIGFLVRKDLGVTTIAEMDGMTIGVAQSATTKDALIEKAAELGISLNYSEFASYPEIKTALTSGRVDAFSVDKSILLGYLDDNTMLLDETFKPQGYGITSKLDNKGLAAYLDNFIAEISADGTLEGLVTKWGL